MAEARGGWSSSILTSVALTLAQKEKILQEVLYGENLIVPGITRTLDFHGRKANAAG
ncbi:MAG: hypothetical protein K0M66_11005 [Thiobacillus sp.]|nr:hypothetical protein [Thiobacillus sp.]